MRLEAKHGVERPLFQTQRLALAPAHFPEQGQGLEALRLRRRLRRQPLKRDPDLERVLPLKQRLRVGHPRLHLRGL